jgi:hypothetical protein
MVRGVTTQVSSSARLAMLQFRGLPILAMSPADCDALCWSVAGIG